MATISPRDHDPGECNVCHKKYDGEHSPRILFCSHTFCSNCIDQILSKGLNRCPICRTQILARSSEEVTLNRAVSEFVQMLNEAKVALRISGDLTSSSFETWQKDLMDSLNKKISVASKRKAEADEIISKKQELKAGYERDMEKINKGIIPALRVICASFQSRVEDIDKVTEGFSAISEEFNQRQKHLEEINRKVKDSQSFATADTLIAEANESNANLQNPIDKLNNLLVLTENENEHSTVKKQRLAENKRKLAVITDITSKPPTYLMVTDIREMTDALRRQIQKGTVYGLHVFKGKKMIAQLSLTDDNELLLHHLKEKPLPSESHVIKYSEILQMVNSYSRRTFIEFERDELGEESHNMGRVFFLLSPDSELARQFFSKCSGEVGTSYAGKSDIWVWDKGHNVYEHLSMKDRNISLEVEWAKELRKEEYGKPQVAGTLRCYYCNESEMDFDILTKDAPEEILNKAFGNVYKGLEVVEKLISQGTNDANHHHHGRNKGEQIDCIIRDCGIVIELP